MRVALLGLAAACAHHAPVVADDPAGAPTVVTCYAGNAHLVEDFGDTPVTDLAAHLKLTVSPSFSTITEEWRFNEDPPRIFELAVDGTTLAVHDPADPRFAAKGELHPDLAHLVEWQWGYEVSGMHIGYTYDLSGKHLTVTGGSSTFESVSSRTVELDEAPCAAP